MQQHPRVTGEDARLTAGIALSKETARKRRGRDVSPEEAYPEFVLFRQEEERGTEKQKGVLRQGVQK